MMESAEFLDPRGKASSSSGELAPRLLELSGRTICLLDIGKTQGDLFLDRLEDQIRRELPVTTIRREKPTFARPAPTELLEDVVRQSDAVIVALAD